MKINAYTESATAILKRNIPKKSQDDTSKKSPQNTTSPADTVEISKAVQKIQTALEEQARMESDLKRLKQQFENSKIANEAAAKEAKTRMKCMMIAMRIQSGDEVPEADKKYLAKNDLGLYARAISMRMEKEKPQKHKRISEDESDETPQVSGSSEITQPTGGNTATAETSSPDISVANSE